jgi:hypothetical protein
MKTETKPMGATTADKTERQVYALMLGVEEEPENGPADIDVAQLTLTEQERQKLERDLQDWVRKNWADRVLAVKT